MDPNDIELPSASEDDDGMPERDTVSGLVKKCREDALKRSMRYFAQASLNERMITGDQFIELNESYEVSDLAGWPSYVGKTSRNLLRNLALTWSSRVTEDRPWVRSYASEPGLDQMAAEVSNKVLENTRQSHEFDDQCFQAAQLVQPHSCVGWKVVWDPLKGPPSPGVPSDDPEAPEHLEGQGEPTGDVAWQLVTIFDYGTDGAENIEDSKWCYFVEMKDEHDARALLSSAGIDEPVSAVKYKDVWDEDCEGVEVVELWWRPDFRFPRGLYVVMVADHVVSAIPFPYLHGELPLAVWKCGARRRSAFGSTHVDDAVYIQKAINEDVAALQQQVRQIGGVKLMASSAICGKWANGNQMIEVDDPVQLQAARYLEPPPRSEVIVQSLEDNVQALYTVYGLNEILSGAENVKSGTSAKSIAYLNKLDSMKMSGASRSLNKAIVRIARQTLKLNQQYVKAPRIAEIAGENGVVAAQHYIGADLAGIDVKLESASATEQMRGQVAGDAQQQIAAGNPDPALREQQQTGIQDTSFAKASRDIARAQAEAALQGEMQNPDPEADPNIAVQEIIAAIGGTPKGTNTHLLVELLRGYQQKTAQNQQQALAASPPQGQPG